MALKRTTGGFVSESGELTIHRREQFLAAVARAFSGRVVRITVEKETRSLAQNGLYWVWNTIVSKELGWDAEDVHEYNKLHYNAKRVVLADPSTGDITEEVIPSSTAILPKDAFAEMMERVQRGWAERGIDLPSSEEEYWKEGALKKQP